MPYQLPQELKTNKFESLPDDLREMAEALMAEKFDIPEVIKEKKKKVTKKKEPYDIDTDYPYTRDHIELEIRLVPRINPYDPSRPYPNLVHGQRRYVPRHIGFSGICEVLNRMIKDGFYKSGYEGREMNIEVTVDRRTDRVDSMRDVERLVSMAFNEEKARGWRATVPPNLY